MLVSENGVKTCDQCLKKRKFRTQNTCAIATHIDLGVEQRKIAF